MIWLKRLRNLRKASICASIAAAFIIGLAVPHNTVLAQMPEPDSTFELSQCEAYRNVLELNDQLYLFSGTVEYATTPTNYDISESYIVRLMTAAGAELRTTTFYPYHDSGYDFGICSIYFSAADAPAWNQPYEVHLQGNPTLHWLESTAGTAMSGAVADDGGVLTDETWESNSAGVNDMTLTPLLPAVGDAYYFGSNGMFNILTVNVGQQGNWTGTYTWEYWDGDEWKAPAGLNDNSTGFTAGTGHYDITYDCPIDWQRTVVNATNLYWLRFRIVTFVALVAQPLGTQSWTNTLTDPPQVETDVFSLWYDGGTLVATEDRLTIRMRSVAQTVENDWGGATDLIETLAGVGKLTDEGDEYFTNSIDNLRTICPDLFADMVTTPEFPDQPIASDFFMGGDDADRDTHGNNWYAQTFTASSGYAINGVWLKSFIVGAPGVLTVGIRATVAGLPTGGDLASGTINANTFTTGTGGDWYLVSFTSDYTLTGGTVYAIVVRALAGNVNNHVAWRVDTGAGYTLGQACSSINAGVAWAAVGAEDFMFAVSATEAYGMTYRNRLANRLVGTPLDMTLLGGYFGLSRMWMSTIAFLIMCGFITAGAVRGAHSFKIATLVMLLLLPFGALGGFLYLEVAIIAGFLSAVAVIYVYFLSKSP